jgi:predicted metal-dependent hydrolase
VATGRHRLQSRPRPADDDGVNRSATIVERRVRLAHPDQVDPAWNARHPELAFAADAVSLLMPYAEPYFVRTVRRALPQLDGPLADEARDFAAQEARHHGEHRRFNDALTTGHPALQRIEGWMARTFGWLEGTRSLPFALAFAAGSETIAFSIARWADAHDDDLFDGVAPTTAALYRWHLAEEVEHKSVAFDVWSALDGSRLRYVAASAMTFVLLAWFTILSTLTLLLGSRWRWSPACWFRLVRWAFSIAFVTLPNMVVSSLPGHHPTHLTDPPGLVTWLRYFDPATGTVPLLDGDRPT